MPNFTGVPSLHARRNRANQSSGAGFERQFEVQSRRVGIWAQRNWQHCRFTGRGKVAVMRSDLDWTLFSLMGVVAWVDTKTFLGAHCTYSQLKAHQVARACEYNRHRVRAGFVCWFRKTGEVVYFGGEQIMRAGRGARFDASNGLLLGDILRFDVSRIMSLVV